MVSSRFYFILVWLTGVLCVQAVFDEEIRKEPELTKEEAFRLLDQYVPLPSWDQEPLADFENILLPVPGEDLPDYELLEKLQDEERLREAIDAVNERYNKNVPVKIAEYFAKRETLFVRDPEQFLTTVEKENIQDLLISHAGDSDFNIHLSLFHKEDLRQLALFTNEQHEEVLSGDENGVMVYYFFDDPNRTIVYFSNDCKRVIAPLIRKEITKSAIQEAALRESPYLSLYRYLLDLTLQMSSYEDEQRLEEEKSELKTPVTKKDDFMLDRVFEYINIFIAEIGWPIIGTVLGGFLGLLILIRSMQERAKRRVYKFPIQESLNHLEFPKGRGSSGILSFKKGADSVEKQEREIHGR